MVESAIFNVHDVALLSGAFLSLVLAILLILRPSHGRLKRHHWMMLSLFFLLGTLHSVDTLLYWSTQWKAFVAQKSLNLFFLFGFALFLQGPLLYWFTNAAIFRKFVLRRRAVLHLLPALVCPVFTYMIYYRYDDAYKLPYVNDWLYAIADPYFDAMIWLQRVAVFVYSVVCMCLLHKYVRHLRQSGISMPTVDLQWLKLLLIGFLALNSWGILTLIETRLIGWDIDSFMGGTDLYLRFLYICALIVYLLKNAGGLAGIPMEHTIAPTPVVQEPTHQLADKLQVYMQACKPYLEPHITVDRLAQRLNVSSKLLSRTINRQLDKTFFEMIGHYRVEEAKQKLTDPDFQDLPIADIMRLCGFSSKSVFNTTFKKSLGITPSVYRNRHFEPWVD